jgi:hypothetical protein
MTALGSLNVQAGLKLIMWSLENELCQLAHAESLNHALYNLKLIKSIGSTFTLQENGPWVRGSADTYIYKFWVREDGRSEEEYIIKACTAFSLVNNLSEILDEWLRRRQLLSDFGVSTPKLIAHGNGVVIEESIPYQLRDQLKFGVNATPVPVDERLIDLTLYSAALYSLGFLSIAPFNDVRSRGKDAVVVDFGQDLGPARGEPVSSKDEIFNLMMNKLSEWEVPISKGVKSAMYDIYEEFISSSNAISTV